MRAIIITLAAAALVGCNDGKKATVSGQFYGEGNRTIYLEELSPRGSKIIDSTKTNSKGSFKLNVHMKDVNPSFYNLRMEGQFLPLLLEPGEKAKINAVGNIYNNYTVTGSKGSELVREFNGQIILTSLRLDSIIKLSDKAEDQIEIQRLGKEYGQTYIQMKRDIINFVMNNSTSLAAIVPFYQPIYGTNFIFEETQDFVYFKLVADSLEVYYPTSPYVRSLRSDVSAIDQMNEMDSMLESEATEVDFPEIEMADALGNVRKLSDLKGKIILLDFTATNITEFKRLSRDMVEVYEKYAPKGFEVFQVSLDLSKTEWINYLTRNQLPWITVSDFKGADSPAVGNYNVKTVPANFLIDRSGNIVAKSLYGKELDQKLASMTAGN